LSRDGADTTVIDGGNPIDPDFGCVVYFGNSEERDSVLDGFTLIHGRGVNYSNIFIGGGILCIAASPVIKNNIITNNKVLASGYGGGIYCTKSSPLIANNTISENLVSRSGGGIACEQSAPIIVGNIIKDNTAFGDAGGIISLISSSMITNNIISGNRSENSCGGVYCGSSEEVVIRNNVIMRNSASASAGGILCYDSTADITNNVIAGNWTESSFSAGGGIYCKGFFAPMNYPWIINNTIVNNSSAKGGGVFCSGGLSPVIINTILWHNSCTEAGPEIYLGYFSGGPQLLVRYSNVMGGQASAHVEENCVLHWGAGMIDADPSFVDIMKNDFHLQYSSPCRDAGFNAKVENRCDFEGDPRIAWGETVDMGADEFYNHFYCTGHFSPGEAIEGKFIGMPATTPVGLFIGFHRLQVPIQHMWGDFHLQAPWFFFPLGLSIHANGVLVVPETIPTDPLAPYDIFMQALIGTHSDSLTNLFELEVR